MSSYLLMALMMKTMGGHEMNAGRAVAANAAERTDGLRAELAASEREQQRLLRELEQLDSEWFAAAKTASSSRPA